MTRLIRSDFKKFFKDKLFFVSCILAVVFAVITPLLYVLISSSLGSDPMAEELLSDLMTAKGLFFSAFTVGNDFGLIVPLLIGIVMFKDYTYGTIRNKIIGGHSRLSIFLSNYTVCFTTLFCITLAYALLTLGVSLPFFSYQSTPFEISDFWYAIESLLFEMCVYLFVAAFISLLCVMVKSVGMVIVLYIAVVFGSSLISGILQGVLFVLTGDPAFESTADILEFFLRINVFNSSATIGTGTAYNFEDVIYYAVVPVAGGLGLLGLGLLKFRRKDLK